MFPVKDDKRTEWIVYLVYLDDGGKAPIKMLGGIVIQHQMIQPLEAGAASIVFRLVPEERRETFREFHASDLYYGKGAFEGLDECKRRMALRELLQLRSDYGIAYVYSAIDTGELNRSAFRSASWLDVAFAMCAREIDDFIRGELSKAIQASIGTPQPWRLPELLSLIVIDEPGQVKDKERIRKNFRMLRRPIAQVMQAQDDEGNSILWSNRLSTPVDEVFFGTSADSIGLQVADACNWVMWKHLSGENVEDLYSLMAKAPNICAKSEPEWSRFPEIFRCHEP